MLDLQSPNTESQSDALLVNNSAQPVDLNKTPASDQIADDSSRSAGQQNSAFIPTYNIADLISLQQTCPVLGPLYAYLTENVLPADNRLARRIMLQTETCYISEDGVLMKLVLNTNKRTQNIHDMYKCIMLPLLLQKQVVNAFHSFAHTGIVRTIQAVRRYYFFDGMQKTVRDIVNNCRTCLDSKRGLKMNKAFLRPLEIVDRPFRCLHMDVLSGLPVTKDSVSAVLAVCDRFTSYLWLFELQDQKA